MQSDKILGTLFAAILGSWVLLAVGMLVVFALMIWAVVYYLRAYQKAPRIDREALVLSKREEKTLESHNSANGGAPELNEKISHFVAFELKDGERLGLTVSSADYTVVKEGDRGILSTKLGLFLAFRRTL